MMDKKAWPVVLAMIQPKGFYLVKGLDSVQVFLYGPCFVWGVKLKQEEVNCSDKVGNMILFLISWYCATLQGHFTGTNSDAPLQKK